MFLRAGKVGWLRAQLKASREHTNKVKSPHTEDFSREVPSGF